MDLPTAVIRRVNGDGQFSATVPNDSVPDTLITHDALVTEFGDTAATIQFDESFAGVVEEALRKEGLCIERTFVGGYTAPSGGLAAAGSNNDDGLDDDDGDDDDDGRLGPDPSRATVGGNDVYAQARALATTGVSMFVSGPPGSGKTYLGAQIIVDLAGSNKQVAVVAATGMAADQMMLGVPDEVIARYDEMNRPVHTVTTLHSHFSMPYHVMMQIGTQSVDRLAADWARHITSKPDLEAMVKALDAVVIDEISMIEGELVDVFVKMLRKVRGIHGGLPQLIMLGDFCQLPPVDTSEQPSVGGIEAAAAAAGRQRRARPVIYAFESDAWKELIGARVLILDRNHRVQDDPEWQALLTRLRNAEISAEVIDLLRSRGSEQPGVEIGEDYLHLYPTNAMVDAYNARQLGQLRAEGAEEHTYVPQVAKVTQHHDSKKTNVTARYKDDVRAIRAVQRAIEAAGGMAGQTVAVGAPVMLLKNINIKNHLVNGAMGRVLEVRPASVIVEFDHGGIHEIKLARISSAAPPERQEDPKFVVETTWLPLTLAWAVTIYKVQGATIERGVYVQLAKPRSNAAMVPALHQRGELLVALSRVRSSSRIVIDGFDVVLAHIKELLTPPSVLRFYNQRFEATNDSESRMGSVDDIDLRAGPVAHYVTPCAVLWLRWQKYLEMKEQYESTQLQQRFRDKRRRLDENPRVSSAASGTSTPTSSRGTPRTPRST